MQFYRYITIKILICIWVFFQQHCIFKVHSCHCKEYSSGSFPLLLAEILHYFKSTPGNSGVTSLTPTGRPAFRSSGCVQSVFTEGAQAIHGYKGRQTDMLSPGLTFLWR